MTAPDEVTTGSLAVGFLEITDRDGDVWVPVRQYECTRFGRRDTPLAWTQMFPGYRCLRQQYGPLTVEIGRGRPDQDRLCPVFDSDGRTCAYGRGHSIQSHMLTGAWADPGPEDPAVFVTNAQLDEYGCYVRAEDRS